MSAFGNLSNLKSAAASINPVYSALKAHLEAKGDEEGLRLLSRLISIVATYL